MKCLSWVSWDVVNKVNIDIWFRFCQPYAAQRIYRINKWIAFWMNIAKNCVPVFVHWFLLINFRQIKILKWFWPSALTFLGFPNDHPDIRDFFRYTPYNKETGTIYQRGKKVIYHWKKVSLPVQKLVLGLQGGQIICLTFA